MTFSSTVMSSNVAGTWKVRPMPARAWIVGRARVTSTPSKTMRPVVGTVSPARQLKKVDLPAPFGPIRPMISPSSTARSAPAHREEAAERFRHVLGVKQHGAPPALSARRDATSRSRPPGSKRAMSDDDAAIEDVGQAGAAAAEPGVGRGLQRDQDQRADQRAEQRAGAAERRDDHHLHRDQNAEAAFRIDEAGLDRHRASPRPR